MMAASLYLYSIRLAFLLDHYFGLCCWPATYVVTLTGRGVILGETKQSVFCGRATAVFQAVPDQFHQQYGSICGQPLRCRDLLQTAMRNVVGCETRRAEPQVLQTGKPASLGEAMPTCHMDKNNGTSADKQHRPLSQTKQMSTARLQV